MKNTKKEYKAPKLTKFGNVSEITAYGGGHGGHCPCCGRRRPCGCSCCDHNCCS